MKRIIFVCLLSMCISFAYTQKKTYSQSTIDSIFQDFHETPGIAIAVVKNGEILYQKGYGLANLSYNIPVSSETIFDVASVSKQFTAACIFLLEEEGKLNLDDPIQKFLPELPVYDDNPITVQNLLYHTSGLRSYLATIYSKNEYWGDSFDNADVINILTRHKGLNFSPNTKHYYSNSNYVLLASIVEKITGKSLGSYAKEKIFEPLGMEHTFFKEERDTIVKNLAIGYAPKGGYFRQHHFHNNIVVGDGGLHTNIKDFVRWNNNLTTGLVGGQDFIEKMTTPGILSNGQKITYAGGLYVENYQYLKRLPTLAHSGNWAGFRSLYYKFLEQDLAFIILSNNANTQVWTLLDELVPLFLPDEMLRDQQGLNTHIQAPTIHGLSLSRSDKDRFCGKYYNTLNGYLRQIDLQGDQLVYIRPGANPTPLIAINTRELVYESAPQVKFIFDENSYDSWIVTINDMDPMPYKRYRGHTYNSNELKQFENKYYSEDLDEISQIVALNNELQILVKGEELVRLTPIAKDLFTSAHWGYIIFDRNANNSITGFTRYDDHLYNLKHTVVDIKRTKSVSGGMPG